MARKKIVYSLATEPIDVVVRNEDELTVHLEERDEYGYNVAFVSMKSVYELYETLGDIIAEHKAAKERAQT